MSEPGCFQVNAEITYSELKSCRSPQPIFQTKSECADCFATRGKQATWHVLKHSNFCFWSHLVSLVKPETQIAVLQYI